MNDRDCPPPNVTIFNKELPEVVKRWNEAFCNKETVSKENPQASTSSHQESVEDDVYSWMNKNDIVMTRHISDLLSDPDIVNNQGSSFTRSLYVMKGLAREMIIYRTAKINSAESC